MKKLIATLFIFTAMQYICPGQEKGLAELLNEGIKLNDNGDYNGALEKYQQALKIDKKSPMVHYEIASTYFTLQDYKKSIVHADKVIKTKTNFIDQAYILKGSALDLLGKSEDAIIVYRQAIANFPKNSLLRYNLALTLYTTRKYEETEQELKEALKINPNHNSSHLLLGYTMYNLGNRVKTMLALYNFLLLEPNGNRAEEAFSLLEIQFRKGVKRGENKTVITLSSKKDNDEFRSAEVMLSLLEASKNTEKNKDKKNCELFFENTNSLFKMLGRQKKNNDSFWWTFYIEFFNAMSNTENVEAFTYYISQTKKEVDINNWLKNNKDKLDIFSKWLNQFGRKTSSLN